MKCLIVAAGQGGRLRARGELKPLVPLAGVPLIERVMAGALAAGADGFAVVSGYRGDELRAALGPIAARLGTAVTHVINDAWSRANGVSLLAAASVLDAPFLLTMCDHLADPAIARALMAGPVPTDGVVLAVDAAIADPINDPIDATRVRRDGDRIVAIGKMLSEYDSFDTGLFGCTPGVFAALRESQRRGDDSISGAIGVLAEGGRALAHEIGGRVWVDVDDARDHALAERLLASGRLPAA